MASHIHCTIQNYTSGTITLNKVDQASGPPFIVKNIPQNSTVESFKAQGGTASGAGGYVIYNLPNGNDQMLILYNISYINTYSFIAVLLQSNEGTGQDYYFTETYGVYHTSETLEPIVKVYEAVDSAPGSPGGLPQSMPESPNTVIVNMTNGSSDDWITLNDWLTPATDTTWTSTINHPRYYGTVLLDGGMSIPPGQTYPMLVQYNYQNRLIYNLGSEAPDQLSLTIDSTLTPPVLTAGISPSVKSTVTGANTPIQDERTSIWTYNLELTPNS